MSNTNEKKKILYVITKSEPFGGAQKYVYDLATNLPKDGWDAHVIFGGSGTLAEKLYHHPHIKTTSLRRLSRDINILDEIVIFASLVRIYMQERPNVVHLNSSKIGGLGALAARIYNLLPKGNPLQAESYKLQTHIVFTAHGWPFNEDRPYWQRALIRFLSSLTVLFSHTVITVSETDARQGKKMPAAQEKIHTIHNGIQSRRFVAKQKARELLLGEQFSQIPKDALWIGSVAELTKNKGLFFAIEGIYRLLLDHEIKKPLVYVIIGSGEEQLRLAHLIEKLGLARTVFLVGFKEDAAQYLKAFDLFLFPSIKEGFPYALLEAGTAGLPVIATDVGGVSEIIQDMETGLLIRPREVSEIEKALFFMLSRTKDLARMKRALKTHVSEAFSTEEMVEKTINLY